MCYMNRITYALRMYSFDHLNKINTLYIKIGALSILITYTYTIHTRHISDMTVRTCMTNADGQLLKDTLANQLNKTRPLGRPEIQ